MKKKYAEVADMIFKKKAFKFGAFPLKLHEKNPKAPLSPYYIDLRTKNNPKKPGPLNNMDCDLIARALWELILEKKLSFQAIAGIPHAGDPIAAAFKRVVPLPRYFRVIKLSKIFEGKTRRIVPMPGFEYIEGEIVLPVDDLVTKGETKVEAIQAIEKEGSVVKNLVVLMDRQEGGRENLKKAGYDLVSCFTTRELIDYYLASGQIDAKKHQECVEYMKNN